MNKAFKERHDFVVAGLNAIPGISVQAGAGTFYAFANVEAAMRTLGIQDDNAFAEYLFLEAEGGQFSPIAFVSSPDRG